MLDLFETPGDYERIAPTGSRRCSRCGEVKPTEEFPMKIRTRGLRRVWCRDCCREYGREHYARNRPVYLAKARERKHVERPRIRAWIDGYLRQHPCVDCGCSEMAVLDFDHRDRSQKDLTVAALARLGTWSRLLREIAKCDVRCANCHRRRTADQFGWTKARGVVIDIAEVRPGLSGRYSRPVGARQDALLSLEPHGLRPCSRCRELKPLVEFPFRDAETGKRGHYCRKCQAAYRRAHYERNKPDYVRRAMNEVRLRREDVLLLFHGYLRSHQCVDCGQTDIVTLEFDHIDPATKTMPVGAMIGRRNWSTILAEIQKCAVRCANCHRRRTAQQQHWKGRISERRGRYRRMVMTRE